MAAKKDVAPLVDETPEEPTPSVNETNPEIVEAPVGPKSAVDLAQEVLDGVWGSFHVSRNLLSASGHDATAVLTLVNDRLSKGAPSTYRPTARQLEKSIEDGEWGDVANQQVLRARLLGAGFKAEVVEDILRNTQQDTPPENDETKTD